MKIAVVAPSSVPFVLGGAERLWAGLVDEINAGTPHDAELIKLPSREHSLPDLVNTYLAFSQLDLSHFDMVISTKYPAWAVHHDNHVVYMQHKLRGLYDTYPEALPKSVAFTEPPALVELQRRAEALSSHHELPGFCIRVLEVARELGPDHSAFAFPGPFAAEVVRALDRVCLQPGYIRRYFAISDTVARRDAYFPEGVRVRAVPHPSNLSGFRCESFDYLFTASRLDGAKRLDLLIDAMRQVDSDTELVIAGTGPDELRLRDRAQGDDRIRFIGRVSDEELLTHYARARAVPFVPFEEDMGLVTFEANLSGKAVITCTDSGGVAEHVDHGRSGFVVRPDAKELADALCVVATDLELARTMGDEGRRHAEKITWSATIDALLGKRSRHSPTHEKRRRAREKLVVLSTFPVHPREQGGQLRSFHLYGALSSRLDVEILSLSHSRDVEQHLSLAPGFSERIIPKHPELEREEQRISTLLGGFPVEDIAAASAFSATPRYVEQLAESTTDASMVLLSHPYLVGAAEAVASDLPWIYDAHNVEFHLKDRILPTVDGRAGILEIVRRAEELAAQRAVLVTACSAEDASALAAEYGVEHSRLLVAPNGVDLSTTSFTPLAARRRWRETWLNRYRSSAGTEGRHLSYIALFVGSGHPPNIEAAAAIVDIAAHMPDVLFALVGSHTNGLSHWGVPTNVLLLNVVSDGAKDILLRSADVGLNPMVSGSGTNLKVIEYLASGLPVVSSELGARGLELEAHRDLVTAAPGDTRAWVRAIRDVLKDSAAVEARIGHARLAAEAYDWRVVGETMLIAIEEHVGRLRQPG